MFKTIKLLALFVMFGLLHNVLELIAIALSHNDNHYPMKMLHLWNFLEISTILFLIIKFILDKTYF